MTSKQDKLARFEEWLKMNGAELRACKFMESELGGIGLFSAMDVNEGIHLVVPLRLAITPMAVLQDPSLGSEYGRLFEEGEVDDRFLIILFLLVEHARENSYWSPYLDVLPSTFNTTLWFKDDELEELKGTALYHATIQQLKNLRSLFNDKVKVLAESLLSHIGMPSCNIEFDDFLWANSVFWTRALNIPFPQSFVFPPQVPNTNHSKDLMEGISGKSSNIWVEGLVPGIDFCNHDPKGKALWEVDDENGYATGVPFSMYLAAGPNIAFGAEDEIRISYGNKGNEELLFLYGFVIEENSDDFLMIHYPKQSLQNVECGEVKCQFLEEQELELRWLLPTTLLHNKLSSKENTTSNGTTYQVSGYSWSGHRKLPAYMVNFVFPEAMMAALRTIAMKEADVNNVLSLLNELSTCDQGHQPSDMDIKAAIWEVCGNAGALQLLVDLLTTKVMELEEISGTEADDTALLQMFSNSGSNLIDELSQEDCWTEGKQMSFTKNKRAAIIYRRGQKILANMFLKEASDFLHLCLLEEQDIFKKK